MKNIELAIKIPEDLYEAYKGRPPMLGDAGMDMIAQAIANGTRIPEGHGDLIDKNYLLDLLKCEKYETCEWRNCTECREEHCIKKHHVLAAPIILEADAESEG